MAPDWREEPGIFGRSRQTKPAHHAASHRNGAKQSRLGLRCNLPSNKPRKEKHTLEGWTLIIHTAPSQLTLQLALSHKAESALAGSCAQEVLAFLQRIREIGIPDPVILLPKMKG